MSTQTQLWPRNKSNENDVRPFHYGKRRHSKKYSRNNNYRKHSYGQSNLTSPNELNIPDLNDVDDINVDIDVGVGVRECDAQQRYSPTNSINSTDSYDDIELNNLIKHNNNNKNHQNEKNKKNEKQNQKQNQIIKNNENNNKQNKSNYTIQTPKTNKDEIEKMFDQVESPIVKNIAKKFSHDFFVLNKKEQNELMNTLSVFMHNRKKKDLNKNILEFVIEQIEYFQQNTCNNPNYTNTSKNNQRKINCLIKGQLINPKIKFI